MTGSALVVPPPGGDWTPALDTLAGVPIFVRIILAAQRAGVQRFLVLSGPETAKLQALLTERPKLKAEVSWVSSPLRSPQGRSAREWFEAECFPVFLLDGATIFAPAVLERMVAAFDGDPDILIPARGTSEGHRGIALVSPRVIRLIAEALDREGSMGWEDLMLTCGDHRRSVLALPDEYFYILDTSALPTDEAERRLYRSLGKSTDTIVIRETRKAAALVVRALVETKATPNHLTLLSFFLGMAAVFLLWKAGYANVLAGALLLVLSFVMDLADGMLARIKFLESKGGGWLDFVLDNVVHLGIFAGLTRIVYLRSPSWQVLAFGILLVGGTLLSGLAFTIYMIGLKGRDGWPGGAKNVDRVLEGVVEAIRHRDFTLLFLLLAVVNRIHWFFWVGAVGANLFWPIVLYAALRRRARAWQLHEKEQGLRP